jgi:hypothetical protein
MPHLNLLRYEGDADDLLARKQRYVDPVTARIGPQAGGLAHITARTADGLLVLNLMTDAAGQENAAMHPDVVEALRESGLPQPEAERYEVVRFVLAPAAQHATTE